MPALLVLCLSVPIVARAESWALKNQGGGEITLTSNVCTADNGAYPSLKIAYTWTDKTYNEGCWSVIDGNVHIVWMNNDGSRNRRVYNINDFKRKP